MGRELLADSADHTGVSSTNDRAWVVDGRVGGGEGDLEERFNRMSEVKALTVDVPGGITSIHYQVGFGYREGQRDAEIFRTVDAGYGSGGGTR